MTVQLLLPACLALMIRYKLTIKEWHRMPASMACKWKPRLFCAFYFQAFHKKTAWFGVENIQVREANLQTPEQVCGFIVSYYRELELIAPKLQLISSTQNSLWQAPDPPLVKANFDASFSMLTERLGPGLWYVIP
ncbi:hypothetical protein V6N13_147043 [Hibiscus sabdariffa]